jgi:GTP cyclohydrolase-4
MSPQLPDVQASTPEVRVGLGRVGVTGVEKLVKVARDGERPLVFTADFEVYVDLPRERKGIDMSRNMEVIDEVLEDAVSEPAYRVEDVCEDAAERLLDKHEYTTEATVEMEAEYVLKERTPESDRPTQGTLDFLASATASEDAPTREEIGVRVTGMTVCPCSQGMMSARAREKLEDLGVGESEVGEFLAAVPQAGHSQRGHATLTVGTRADAGPDVDLWDLVSIARDAMSARIYNLAKRPDEDHMTFEAHANAKFVEDCVRSMAHAVVEELEGLPDAAVVRMQQDNEESIHEHNAYAERIAEMGTLRGEVNGE